MTEKTKEPKTSMINQNMLITTAEPAPLGLIGLAVAALVLATADLGMASSAKSLLIPWVLCFGATSQLVAGIMEFKRNNVFGSTVFTTYAMTMYAIAFTVFLTIFSGVEFDVKYYGYGLIAILVFTIIATIASMMTNKMLFIILILVDLAVIALIPHYLMGTNPFIAGVFLLLVSITSFYTAGAILINTMAGKTVLPLGKALWKP